jgi:DNA polymerase III delta prime subunit
MDDIILPERIRNYFKNGASKNYIFHGQYGTGKTSLARILVKGKNVLEINTSLYPSIDVLRTDIEKFCKSTNILDTSDDLKYVFLEEFERASSSYQDAFKAFVEEYRHRVRFIITTNHYNKITKGVKSRFTSINFDSSPEEEKELKKEIFTRLSNICDKEEIKIDNTRLASIIKKQFPDIRQMLIEIEDYKDTGNDTKISNINNELKIDLYRTLFKKDISYNDIYHFVMDNFGDENVDGMFNILSRPFVDFMIEKNQSVDKLFECNYVISEYHPKLESQADPIIIAMTVIGKLRKILIT